MIDLRAADRISDSLTNVERRSLAVSLLLSALIYSPSLFWALGHDQNVFGEVGHLLMSGRPLYSGVWEIKPPNVYYAYGLIESILGPTTFAVRFLDFAFTLTSAALCFFLTRRYLRTLGVSTVKFYAPPIAAVFFSATALRIGLADTAQAEYWGLPFLLGSFLLIERQKFSSERYHLLLCGLAGSLLGAAAFFKSPLLLFLLPLLLFANGWKLRGSAVIGVAAWSMLQIGLLAVTGSLAEFFRITENLLRYHASEEALGLWPLVRALWVYFDLWLLVAVAGLFVLPGGLRKPIAKLLILMLTGFAVVVVQQKGWGYHYTVILPGAIPLLAILVVAALGRLCEIAKLGMPRYIVIPAAIAVLLVASPAGKVRIKNFGDGIFSLTNHSHYLASLGSPFGIYYPIGTDELSKAIASPKRSESVFLFAHEPGAYLQSGRAPASRFVYTLLFRSRVMTPEDVELLEGDLAQSKPALLAVGIRDSLNYLGVTLSSQDLLHSPKYAGLARWVKAHYEARDTVGGKFLLYYRR